MNARDAGAAYLRALGRALRDARKAAGISQEQLALKIKIDRTYLSGVERGTRNPSIRALFRIAQGLGLPPSALLAAAEGAIVER